MAEIFASFALSTSDILLLALCAMIVGMAKTGVVGVYHIVVPLLAIIFGGQASTGILLPILILADIIAVVYYRRAAEWQHVFRLFPPALLGVILATWVGQGLSDDVFQILMGGAVLLGISIMLVMERRKREEVPTHPAFGWGMGLAAGFTTMIGNAAGPIMAVYLLAMRLPKNAYIGTTAWFFFFINLSKVPFHLFAWHSITVESLLLDLSMLPAVAIGGLSGIWIVRHIPDRNYRKFVIAATILSALMLFW